MRRREIVRNPVYIDMCVYPVDVVRVGIELIESCLIFYVEGYQNKTRQPNGQACYINDCIDPVLD